MSINLSIYTYSVLTHSKHPTPALSLFKSPSPLTDMCNHAQAYAHTQTHAHKLPTTTKFRPYTAYAPTASPLPHHACLLWPRPSRAVSFSARVRKSDAGDTHTHTCKNFIGGSGVFRFPPCITCVPFRDGMITTFCGGRR